MKTDSVSNQLRWVILLLAAAVILPTVCLLWFMNQAVRNEQLAVRQKLLDICGEAVENLQTDFIKTTATQMGNYRQSGIFGFDQNVLIRLPAIRKDADSIVIYDNNGSLIYPVPENEITSTFSEPLAAALDLEQNGDYVQALEIYTDATDPNQPTDLLFSAYTGQLRCLEKLGLIYAMDPLFSTLLGTHENDLRSRWSPEQLAMLRVMQYETVAAHWDTYHAKGILDDFAAWYRLSELYPSSTTIWALGRILKVAEAVNGRYKNLDKSIAALKKIIRTETLALTGADFLDAKPVFKEHATGVWFTVPTEPQLYIIRVPSKDHMLFFLKTSDNFISSFEPLIKAFPIRSTQLVLYDNLGRIVYGAPPLKTAPFLISDLNRFSNGWKLELYFNSNDPFSAAADHQATIYKWTGILVALLILGAGAVSIRAVNQQIKMNRLKNDFIATVTHELKTPLASMRLLVDTLLEGHYEGENTSREYLGLISNENKRLTHLIDSFLTFSRMERNKQVFDFQPTPPAEIAAAASEAMGGKFDSGDCQCEFTCTVAEKLPLVSADRDGMVTVLVNLLDNAYKYTNDDKKIELNVYEDKGFVCFAVKDNGIGLSSRAQKKIFSRFYQVDSRLSRRAEGCGLGLSIVQFIVDAHKGTIEVESKTGEGSTFTVKLPTT